MKSGNKRQSYSEPYYLRLNLKLFSYSPTVSQSYSYLLVRVSAFFIAKLAVAVSTTFFCYRILVLNRTGLGSAYLCIDSLQQLLGTGPIGFGLYPALFLYRQS